MSDSLVLRPDFSSWLWMSIGISPFKVLTLQFFNYLSPKEAQSTVTQMSVCFLQWEKLTLLCYIIDCLSKSTLLKAEQRWQRLFKWVENVEEILGSRCEQKESRRTCKNPPSNNVSINGFQKFTKSFNSFHSVSHCLADGCLLRVWKGGSWSRIPAPFSRESRIPYVFHQFPGFRFSFPEKYIKRSNFTKANKCNMCVDPFYWYFEFTRVFKGFCKKK